MSHVATELAALLEGLSEERAKSLLDYARYLAEKQDDEEWERVVERATKRPKFAEYMAEVEQEIREGRAEPIEVGYRRYRAWARAQARNEATSVKAPADALGSCSKLGEQVGDGCAGFGNGPVVVLAQ